MLCLIPLRSQCVEWPDQESLLCGPLQAVDGASLRVLKIISGRMFLVVVPPRSQQANFRFGQIRVFDANDQSGIAQLKHVRYKQLVELFLR